MTTDDKLLLADLERIASDVENSLLDDYDEIEHRSERVKIDADDFSWALSCARRASRELETFRERLERRLRSE